jgi:hypothetical protein
MAKPKINKGLNDGEYYWVKFSDSDDEAWQPARWDEEWKCWMLCGSDEIFRRLVIGSRIEREE